MNRVGEVLFCRATRQTKTVGPGNWFFHTGQWAACGELSENETGECTVNFYSAPSGKELPSPDLCFPSVKHALQFVSSYFEVPVRQVPPSEFPRPEDL